MLMATARMRPASRTFGIRLPTHHAAEPVNDVNDANAGDCKLECSEKRRELYQANWPQIEKSTDCENKL